MLTESENNKALTIAFNKQAINIAEAVVKTNSYLEELNKNLNGLEIDEEMIKKIKVLKNQKYALDKFLAELLDDEKIYLDLSSSFTNIKISHLLIGDKSIEVSSYPNCIAEFCRYLMDKDNNRFEKYVIDNSILNKYFSANKENFKSSVKIDDNLYLNTNMNSNAIINILKKIKDAYGLEEEIKFAPTEINI